MRRREFVGCAMALPFAARAEQPAMPVIGFLSSASLGQDAGRLRAFHQQVTRWRDRHEPRPLSRLERNRNGSLAASSYSRFSSVSRSVE
jgi:hypothetical protein